VIKQAVKKTMRRAGYLVSAYEFINDPEAVRMKFLEQLGVDLVLDVGANDGQYGSRLRGLGYGGRIVSFEPLRGVHARLKERSSGDPLWETLNCALGDQEGSAEINVSQNTWSSSLLDMLPEHVAAAPDSVYQGTETIAVQTLDSVLPRYHRPGERLFLKIDTQGFGMKVLSGAEKSLDQVLGIHIEMSLVPLYRGEPLLGEIVTFLQWKGYSLVHIEPEYVNPVTGQQLQVNGLFLRSL